jgi:hypothetical protein
MTVNDGPEEYREVPPSQAPQLVPWNENSTFLSPGGSVAGISAFADSATSPSRSRASRIFIRVVVLVILISLAGASIWRMGGPF